MTSAITVRRATPEDRPAVAMLLDTVDRLHYGARPDIWRAPVGEDTRLDWMSSGDEHALFVAEDGGRVIGFVHIYATETSDFVILTKRRFANLSVCVVHPERRGRGVARALLDAAESWTRGRGLDTIELNVAAFNDARDAWEGLGFAPYQVRMEKKL